MYSVVQRNVLFYSLLLRLPAELLSLVLLFASGTDVLDYFPAAQRRRTLCLVCRSWASSLYNTPRAWTKLTIVFGSKTPLETLSSCLLNSREALIEVAVEVRVGHENYESLDAIAMQEFIHASFILLSPHFHHVAVFRVICPERSSAELALSYIARMEGDRVHSMYLALNLTSGTTISRDHHAFLSSLPCLTLLYTARCLPPSNILFCGSTVTDLQLVFRMEQKIVWHDLKDALSSFQRLKSLLLSGVVSSEILAYAVKITLPMVTHLDFTLFMPPMAGVLHHIATPSLQSLRLALRDGRDVRWMMEECAHMGQATSVELAITPRFSDDLLLVVLRAFTAVKCLDLSGCSLDVRERVVYVLRVYAIRLERLTILRFGWWISDCDAEDIIEGAEFASDCVVQFPETPL
ncbi:hypothetical protein C8R47DRAFT_1206990 [Mycena vitilis]|nr:hypothetical protein C8R47DRAFT_1206990 [Mycena vitilis]